MKEVLFENVYLYSVWSGEFKCFEGRLIQSPIWDNRAVFENRTKVLVCSNECGVMHKGLFWFTDRDDELARRMFIDYEELQIEKLQEKIGNHLIKIKMIKGE